MAHVGQWRIRAEIAPGRGGQAHLYEVARPDDGESFAMKRLRNPKRAERFFREIKAMERLGAISPGLVPAVIDTGVDDKCRPFYVMPLFRAGSLEDRVRERVYVERRLEWLRMLQQVGRLLAEAHRHAWAHRDMKPDNVLIDDAGRPLLADFGLALLADPRESRLTETQEMVGSRRYIAPENESGLNVETDQRAADCYAFGKICWAVLVGDLPPAREQQLEAAHRLSERLQDRLLDRLDLLCRQLLTVDPAQRLTDWQQINAELEAVCSNYEADRPAVGGAPTDRSGILGLAQRVANRPELPALARARSLEEERAAALAGVRVAVHQANISHRDEYARLSEPLEPTLRLEPFAGSLSLSEMVSGGHLALPLEHADGSPTGLDALDLAALPIRGADSVVYARPRNDQGTLPGLQLLAWVEAINDQFWIVRGALVSPFGAYFAPRGPDNEYRHVVGPLRLGLQTSIDRATAEGHALAERGIDLFGEYLARADQGWPIHEPAGWEPPLSR